MKTANTRQRVARALALALLGLASAGAWATGSRGTSLDTRCASLQPNANAPQQSRPYRASGNSCRLCHNTNSPSRNDLNALGTAQRGGQSLDAWCINTAPINPAISAPANGTSVTQGQPVTFTGSGTDPDNFPLTYTWKFSNGLPDATGQSVTVPMVNAGAVTATLELRDATGAIAATKPTRSVTVNAVVNQAPNGSIDAPAANVTVVQGASVAFQASGTDPDGNTPLAYAWNFGGGAPASSVQNPTVIFNTVGTFSVSLTVTDAKGLADPTPATRTVTVTAPAPTNQAPNGSITAPAAPVSITQGQSVAFQSSGSDPDGNTPLAFAWDFGGGAPASAAQNPSVMFNTVGTFTVRLTVTDALGLADPTPATTTVTVTAPVNQAPNGSIVAPANDTTVTTGATVAFQGSGTDPDGNTPLAFRWNFSGAAADSTAQNPSVKFAAPGTYTVTLTVTDAAGLADPTPATRTITVRDPVAQKCTDADGDGYSPDGGVCGPVDCNDNNAAVNPGATEQCGDGIDNDCDGATDAADRECNGADCVGKFFTKPVVITRARWDRGDRELKVTGNGAQSGAAVTVFDATSGALLGTTVVRSTGTWEFEDEGLRAAPCRVRVEINGGVGEAAVSGAPSNCGSTTPPPPAAPVASADSYTTDVGRVLSVAAPGVLANDSAASGRTLTAQRVSGPASGTLNLQSNGAFTYTPAAGFSGNVSFTYRASDGQATSGTTTVTITVRAPAPNQAPEGSITAPAGNVTIERGQSVAFQGSGSDPDGNTPLAFAWDFGGGAPASTAQNPSVAFANAGTYTVRLTVSDAKGLADPTPATRTVTVVAPNQAPDGRIGAPNGNVTIERGQSIAFQGSGSDPDGNTPLAFAWDFGGGAPASTAQNPSVTFANAGTYAVRLTVSDAKGLADPSPATLTVTVLAPNQAPDGVIVSPATNVSIAAGESISFRGDGADPDANLPLSYAWDFGGGAPATTTQSPMVTFANAGTYTVRLTVTDAKGLADPSPATRTVTVSAAPTQALRIERAEWDDNALDLRGSGAPGGATVTVRNAASGAVLFTLRASSSGSFRVERRLSPAPCAIRVEAGNRVGTREVEDAPRNCVR